MKAVHNLFIFLMHFFSALIRVISDSISFLFIDFFYSR
ncbi:unnamed protein product [Wuchereria bancrofti]|uniref:Uncharacterized protein n=1 Tax=Wuchereria bancrofti TaxID=6293 RepID=A0A3P7EEA8_WUCBA|nr:unnamed protein product [Wuchereria bancrofti]